MSESSINYKRFDKGLDVDADPDNMDDAALRQGDNIILPPRGGFSKRNGCSKVNEERAGDEIAQVFEWLLSNGRSKKMVMCGKKLCEISEKGKLLPKIELARKTIGYSTQAVDVKRGITDLLVFVDGNDLYEYGGFDWTAAAGTQTVGEGSIVKNLPVSTHGTNAGIVGHFYRAKMALGSVALGSADYGDASKWDDVTDVTGVISDVVRPVVSTYLGHDYTTTSGVRTVGKGTIIKNTPVSTHATSPGSVDRYYKAKMNFASLDLRSADYGNAANWEDVTGTATAKLDPIRKCTMLLWYSTGMCLLAAGNPEDGAALYKSLPGEPNNWKSDIEKLYPAGGSYGPITGMRMMMRSVLVSYKSGWRHYNGTTLTGEGTDVTWRTINIPVGSVNNEIVLTPQSLTFIGNDGLYRVDQSILNDDMVVVVQQEFFKNLAQDRVKKYFDALLYRENVKLAFHDYKLYIGYCQYDYKTSDGNKDIRRGDIVLNSPVSRAVSKAGTAGRYYQALGDMGKVRLATAAYGEDSKWADVTPLDGSSTPAAGASAAFNNSVLVYDWQQKSFVRFRGWQVNDWATLHDGKLLFATKNFVLQTNAGYNDIDVLTGSLKPVIMKVLTKPFRFGNEKTMHLRKYVKRMYLFTKQYMEQCSSLKISIVSDYISNEMVANLAESLVWGRVYGPTRWGFTDTITQQADFKKDGTRHQVIFYDDALDNPITVYGIGFDFEMLAARASVIPGENLLEDFT